MGSAKTKRIHTNIAVSPQTHKRLRRLSRVKTLITDSRVDIKKLADTGLDPYLTREEAKLTKEGHQLPALG